MDKPKILSGHELVARGTTKIDGSLPEIGLKDVIPNGSWLEQKQIQSALEARKHLIEVERIEKGGVLSHADWREDLMLAEVTQQCGGYWQYLGHNIGQQLFLNPEEALFLIEINSLRLKYNDVTISLQQAYSLLLRSKISLFQYKVYASLGRLGYKVFRHDKKLSEKETSESCSLKTVGDDKETSTANGDEIEPIDASTKMAIDQDATHEQIDNNTSSECNSASQDVVSSSKCSDTNDTEKEVLVTMETDPDNVTKDSTGTNVNNNNACSSVPQKNDDSSETNFDNTNAMEPESVKEIDAKDAHIDKILQPPIESDKGLLSSCNARSNNGHPVNHHSKLEILQNRKQKPCNSKDMQKSFEIVPDIFQKHVVTVKAAEEKYVPSNVCLNNTDYVLHIDKIKSKVNDRPTSTDSRTYSIPDEVSGAHVLRVGDSSPNGTVNNWSQPFAPNERFNEQNHQFNLWRPRSHMNFIHYNLLFQRPFIANTNFQMFQRTFPRLQLFPRPPPLIQFSNAPNFNTNSENQNVPNNRKRMRDGAKQYHFQAIKRLSSRLKHLLQLGHMQTQNIVSLQRLIQTYNMRYKVNLLLNEEMEIVNNENIVETIELDDEEESSSKKPRTESVHHKYEDNFNRIKQLALKLKDLDVKNKATARHRRAFSNLVKRFNKSYNADVSMTNYDVFDQRHVSLDSSSDSDCIVEELPATPCGKKLRNPFNILKRLSEKHNSSISKATTSKETKTDEESMHAEDKRYSQLTKETFKDWLPSEDDFGRAEVPPKSNMYNYLIDSKREEYLYEFIKNQENIFDNWLDIKTSFLRSIAETAAFVQSDVTEEDRSELRSIIGPEDCTDVHSILNKLSIIPSYDKLDETSLCIDFDVYNRDIQNFKKSNPPKPHFRVICLNESSTLPTGIEVKALQAQYKDNVAIVFAVVSLGSISYLQINPTNLPVYIPIRSMKPGKIAGSARSQHRTRQLLVDAAFLLCLCICRFYTWKWRKSYDETDEYITLDFLKASAMRKGGMSFPIAKQRPAGFPKAKILPENRIFFWRDLPEPMENEDMSNKKAKKQRK